MEYRPWRAKEIGYEILLVGVVAQGLGHCPKTIVVDWESKVKNRKSKEKYETIIKREARSQTVLLG